MINILRSLEMKNSSRKNYTLEFKIEAVRLIESECYSLSEASIRLGIPKSTLSKWKGKHGRNHHSHTCNNKENTLSLFEQKQIRKELERVRRERDILKKALAYFAADPLK